MIGIGITPVRAAIFRLASIIPTIFNTLGTSTLKASDVVGLQALAVALDLRLTLLETETPSIYNTLGTSTLLASDIAGLAQLANDLDTRINNLSNGN